jgi:hypothetical protein
MWLRKAAAGTFIRWQVFFLKTVAAVDPLPGISLDIRTGPGSKTTLIRKTVPADCFKVTDVKGDWMRIKTIPDCSEGTVPLPSGWIQWRRDGKLVIGYSLMA